MFTVFFHYYANRNHVFFCLKQRKFCFLIPNQMNLEDPIKYVGFQNRSLYSSENIKWEGEP